MKATHYDSREAEEHYEGVAMAKSDEYINNKATKKLMEKPYITVCNTVFGITRINVYATGIPDAFQRVRSISYVHEVLIVAELTEWHKQINKLSTSSKEA